MIKFFRKIRQNLLMENLPTGQVGKTGRYFKYAIGEIILVVVGILIAVQINNWNQLNNRAQLEKTLLEQLKIEVLNVYGDIYSDFNVLELGSMSHYNIIEYIEKDVAYNNRMCFDFAFIKDDEYIYPSIATYSRIKEEGLDIISNDTIRRLTQGLYESGFPRMSKGNSFNPDISETWNEYYLEHFKLNTDYSLKYEHTFKSDTLSGEIYEDGDRYPYERTRFGKKRIRTIGFVPLDFESLKKDHKFRLLLDQTHDYRRYKRRQYFFAKRRIKILINLIDKELAK